MCIRDSFSTAEMQKSTGMLGGIAGDNNGGTIKNSYFTGYCNTTGTAGGIAGDNRNAGQIQNCYIAAYLSGATVFSAAPNAKMCIRDRF